MNRTFFNSVKEASSLPFSKAAFIGIIILLLSLISLPAFAQFEAAEFDKITKEERAQFEREIRDISLTGQGLYEDTKLDDRQTNEIRARLQALFGDPTQTLEDLIYKENFRPGKAIQFEYWFMVNDSIPLMVLDWNGPFGSGLTYGGASKYVDLMPQIKREFVQKLLSVEEFGEFKDYFYSPEKEQWYIVKYEDGKFRNEEIDSPEGMSID
ncbi:hypothetical protein [Fodinibius sp.]|uniref:hypothetical protein n=1 Tax=Fodinibius sp. TaxID=1872440 RepID=UPI002ACD403C|nr:hypothetical protein [Fodinibius sp.]MDZ7657937.1 hypothetical protein [Fodinibius sp.]